MNLSGKEFGNCWAAFRICVIPNDFKVSSFAASNLDPITIR